MADIPNGKPSRVHLDGAINLGHIISVVLTLVALVAGWVTLDARVATLERDMRAQKTDVTAATVATDKAVVGAETRLLTRITEQRAHMDQTQVRTADDIREIKTLMRDGFRDLDQKLDKKADRPGR